MNGTGAGVRLVWACLFILAISVFCLPFSSGLMAQDAGDEEGILPFEDGDTLEEIRYKIDHNGYSFTVSDNPIFSMPAEEKAAFFTRRAPRFPKTAVESDIGPLKTLLGRKTLPTSFDWRDVSGHSYIGPVRDQGGCGSCYAFGANAAAEGTYNFAMGLYDSNCIDLSESYIIWCLGRISPYSSHFFGCDGSDYDYAELDALVEVGVGFEDDFPYQESDPGSCTHWGDQTIAFQSWHRVPCNDIDAIKTAIMTYGVVDAAVYVGSAFEAYNSGIYEDTNTSCYESPCYYTPTNHAISLVGWDDSPPEGGGGVWILRNSWGDTSWGEDGYMRIRYTSAYVSCEVCYLVYENPITPTPAPTATPSPTPVGYQTPSPTPAICTRLDERFAGFDSGTRPDGWTFTGCSQNSDTYTSVGDYGAGSPSLKLDATGDRATSASFAGGDWLQFWVKGKATDVTSSLLVEEYYSYSSTWTEVTEVQPLPVVGTLFTRMALDGSSSRVRFTYTKSSGDLALDDVLVSCLITPTPTPRVITPTPPPTAPPTVPPTATPTAAPTALKTPTPPPTVPPTATPSVAPTAPPTATPAVAPSATPTPAICVRLDEGFNGFDTGTRPDGWIFTGCDQNTDTYTTAGDYGNASPSLKLDATDDRAQTATFLPGEWIQFWVKGQGTDTTSSLLVEQYASGGGWSEVTEIVPLPAEGTVFSGLALNSSSSQARFIYTKSLGDLALDDVLVKCLVTPTPAVTATPASAATPTAAPTVPPTATPTAQPTEPPVATPTAVPVQSTPTPVIAPTPPHLVVDWDDYDGDGTTDIAVYDPSTGEWRINEVTSGLIWGGGAGDIPAPADYDGDGAAEVGYFDRFSGEWYVLSLAGGVLHDGEQWGDWGDVPVPGDYDGDGTAELAVFRPSANRWLIRNVTSAPWGIAGDIPVPGDYNGDRTTDIAMLRPSSATWFVRGIGSQAWWRTGDAAVPMDYNGDGTTELAVYRSSVARWYMRHLLVSTSYNVYWGVDAFGDIPVVGDFDGDGSADPTVFRPPTDRWLIRYSSQPSNWVPFPAGDSDIRPVGATSY